MSARLPTCVYCGIRTTSNRKYLRCGECWAAIRRVSTKRYSPAPTPQPTPCRVWQGSVDRDGYGHKRGRVHRWVWQSVYGPIPDGMVVMHKCDNPPCFRLDHLQLGTVADNNADRDAKGRRNADHNPLWLHKSGESHTQAKLCETQVALIKRRVLDGCNQRALAKEFGVCPATITNIKKGKVWSWVEPSAGVSADPTW